MINGDTTYAFVRIIGVVFALIRNVRFGMPFTDNFIIVAYNTNVQLGNLVLGFQKQRPKRLTAYLALIEFQLVNSDAKSDNLPIIRAGAIEKSFIWNHGNFCL